MPNAPMQRPMGAPAATPATPATPARPAMPQISQPATPGMPASPGLPGGAFPNRSSAATPTVAGQPQMPTQALTQPNRPTGASGAPMGTGQPSGNPGGMPGQAQGNPALGNGFAWGSGGSRPQTLQMGNMSVGNGQASIGGNPGLSAGNGTARVGNMTAGPNGVQMPGMPNTQGLGQQIRGQVQTALGQGINPGRGLLSSTLRRS